MSWIARLLRRSRAQDGAVIVIVAVLLTCSLGAGALAIDLGSGRQAQQRAQAGADAAAAAGADQIPISPPTTPAQTETQIQMVRDAATTEAQANGACAACVTVDYPYHGSDYTRVGVSISGASDATVGGAEGRSTIPVSASAVAAAHDTVGLTPTVGDETLTNTITTTSTTITHGSSAIFFAKDTSCSGGITMSGNSGLSVTGETFSNGGIHIDKPSDYDFNGPVYYQSGCSSSGVRGAQAAAPVAGWPEDFTNVALSTICAGTTIKSTDITISNDQTLNGPICTTGKITITSSSHLSGNVTFVANQIILQGTSNATLRPYYQDLLFYQTGSGQMQMTDSSGYSGQTIFVPNGSLLISGTSHFGENSPPGFIEAQDITITSTSNTEIKGDGTGAAGTTSTSLGTTTSLSVTQTPTTITNTTSLGSSLVQ